MNDAQSETTGDLGDLIPVRMLNEVMYCPRLCHIEWVQGQFADNADTAQGRLVHRAVDNLPAHRRQQKRPAGEDPPQRVRSVEMSSERLGIITKIDLVDLADGVATPVEFKRGKPAPTETQLWDPELVQLAAQAAILADNGIEAPFGEVYFNETRARVRVEFDEHTDRLLSDAIAACRELSTMVTPPPPLVDSPKCPRCSLVSLCLPDEIGTLSGAAEHKPRVLMPSGDRRQPLYVTSPGATVGKTGDRIVVRVHGESVTERRIIDTSQLCVFGTAQITSQVHRELFRAAIPTMWLSSGGWLNGIAQPVSGTNVAIRVRQALRSEAGDLPTARRMIEAKILNSRTMLMRNARKRDPAAETRLKRLAEKAARATDIPGLLGIEGTAARTYFQQFSSMFGLSALPHFELEQRNRRPPKDPINALLSFSYSLLTKELVAAVAAVGMDPFIGLFHRVGHLRPAAALDLMEEFRPIVADSVVIQVINNGEVGPSDFVTALGGVTLKPDARRKVIAAFERRVNHEIKHPTFGYKVSYRRIFEVQARVLAAHLLGELDTYTGFRTR